MHFAKLFTVDDNKQLLCVLRASEDDGAPEIQVTTYVAGICVVFANRLVEVGAPIQHPEALMARTQALFGSMNQDDAEEAYRMAVEFAARQAAGEFDGDDALPQMVSPQAPDLLDEIPFDPTALDVQLDLPSTRRGWLDIPMVSVVLH